MDTPASLRVGSLFSGIGGFDLGFERCGMRTVWQVEHDPYCQFVLHKNFPDAKRYNDVRSVSSANLDPIDVICGGFPCQDISHLSNSYQAGEPLGINGTRSGLWGEFARLIRDLRPRYVVIENSIMLRRRGLDRVLSDLASCGYDAEWDCLPAAAFGAPHRRERLFVVSYPCRDGLEGQGRESRLLTKVSWEAGRQDASSGGWWTEQPEPPGVADGFPYRMDKDFKYRVQATGNALLPQVAEWIGRQIVKDAAEAV